nr:hypothetical protein [Tanacetum cinerariifolium]
MDEALVPHARRLRIGRSNFRLLSDISSKESTLQLVYDVLRLTPFFKAFLVTADVPEIYMQELWATAIVHHYSIRFKMDNKKHIVNLESFKEMLHICPRLPNQPFVEQPFEEEILAFLWFFGHSGAIRRLTDDPSIPRRNKVNWHYVRDDHTTIKLVSKHQNTQQFGAMLPIELTNADIRNSDAYKKYYAVATGATPPKPKVSVRKTRSSSDTTVTPSTAAAGPRLSTSSKGKQPATTSKVKSLSALSKVAMTKAQQLKLDTKKSLQQTHISQASGSGADEGTGSIPGVPTVHSDESEEEISWNSTDEEGDDDNDDERDDGDNGEEGNDDDDDAQDDDDDKEDEEFIHPSLSTHAEEETRDEESFDSISKTPENTDDEGNGEENLGMNVAREEGQDEEDEEDELYRDVTLNLGRGIQMGDVHTTQEFEDSHVTLTPVNPDGQQQSSSVSSQFVTSMLNPTPDAGIESIFETTSQMDVQTPTSVAPLPVSAPILTPSTISTITTTQQAPTPPTTAPSTLLYMDQRMNEAVKVAVQLQSDRLRNEAQAENDEYLKTIDENMQKIIKEQVKEQVKVQVSKILPKIEQTVNKQLEAEVLTWSSILIEKMEGNKSIQRSNEQRNLYKALVKAYESDKIILDTYEDTVTLKRRHDDDADKDEEPSAGSDRGSKRRREGKEPESASAPKEKATRSAGKSTQRSKSRQTSASESATAEEPMQTTFEIEEPSHLEFETGADDQPIVEPSQHPEWFSQQKKPPTPDRDWNKTFPATHRSIQPWMSELAKLSDSRSSFNKLMDTPVDFSAFLMNRLKVDTLTPELLVGPTYELMKGSCKSLVELEFILEEVYKATTDQLDWVNPEGQQYPHNLLKPLPLIPNSRVRRVIQFYHFMNNDIEYLRGGASSRKYTTFVTKTKAADYGHIKWIEYLVPRTMWIQEPIGYDKHALWGISHWGRKPLQVQGRRLQKAPQSRHRRYVTASGSRKADKSDSRRTLCFQCLSSNVYKKHHNPKACGRSSTRCRKLPEEAQPNTAGYVPDGTLTDVRTALDDRLKRDSDEVSATVNLEEK